MIRSLSLKIFGCPHFFPENHLISNQTHLPTEGLPLLPVEATQPMKAKNPVTTGSWRESKANLRGALKTLVEEDLEGNKAIIERSGEFDSRDFRLPGEAALVMGFRILCEVAERKAEELGKKGKRGQKLKGIEAIAAIGGRPGVVKAVFEYLSSASSEEPTRAQEAQTASIPLILKPPPGMKRRFVFGRSVFNQSEVVTIDPDCPKSGAEFSRYYGELESRDESSWVLQVPRSHRLYYLNNSKTALPVGNHVVQAGAILQVEFRSRLRGETSRVSFTIPKGLEKI